MMDICCHLLHLATFPTERKTNERTREVVLHRRAAASVREADGAFDHAPREEAQPSAAVRRAWGKLN